MNKVEWLKTAVFYNIYPQSYYDSNGDGIGDLNGIIEKLDYINCMGFNALWLNPFYESPFRDGGYDVSDYYKVAPRYGCLEDFKRLCEKAHELGIKVCIDLVGGHTSIDHPWFVESAKAEQNEYTNRYIWSDNWLNTPTKAFINGYSERDIGVNDVWHEIGANNGVDEEKFEKIYCMLIEEIKEALPELKIMVLEPFCLKGPATDDSDEQPDKWNMFYTEVKKRAAKVKAVAEKYGLVYVEFQDKFDKLAQTAENTYWLMDGVHPTPMGHELIKREWLKAFEQFKILE